MTNIFGAKFIPTLVDPLPNRQGRSKKKLRPVVKYQGGMFVARFAGRPSRSFGATEKEALNNLQAGG